MVYVLLLGTVAFATVAPMQMRVLQQAGAQGANLASSLNIAAFNLGNALGAWVGGLVLSGIGLLSLGWSAPRSPWWDCSWWAGASVCHPGRRHARGRGGPLTSPQGIAGRAPFLGMTGHSGKPPGIRPGLAPHTATRQGAHRHTIA
jgi:hypothetical protein